MPKQKHKKHRYEPRARTKADDEALVTLAEKWSASLKLYNPEGNRYLWLQFAHA